MDWILSNLSILLALLFGVSELAAALAQLIYPENQGLSGFLATLVKILQKLGAKDID